MTRDSERPGDEIQHCECGNDTYHVKRQLEISDIRVWAECTECGRPTGVMGDGLEKQQQWYNDQ